MTIGLMRKLAPSSLPRTHLLRTRHAATAEAVACTASSGRIQRRWLAKVRDCDGHSRGFSELWFSGTGPSHLPEEPGSGLDHTPPDERTLKLGKTIRILHTRLPTLLASPLPQEILSPQITLRLFPSTHPHLPTVTGKIGYTAALWTSPVAWGRVPVVGNVKLIILSERMVKGGQNGSGNERLLVRWKTCGKSRLNIKGVGNVNLDNLFSGTPFDSSSSPSATSSTSAPANKEFWGLFIFEFDEEGRVLTHTIEHAEEGSNDEKMTKVVSVTDWLLGKAWGKKEMEESVPGLALGCEIDDGGGERVRSMERR